MEELNQSVLRAQNNECAQEELIRQYRAFILKTASESSKRYITEHDDEWSVALGAFSEAVRSYDGDKGQFLSFARMVITRRLADHFRSASRNCEIPVDPLAFAGENEEEEGTPDLRASESLRVCADNSIKEEIEAISHELAWYGISFFDLAAVSPKAKKTKKACAHAVAYVRNNPILLHEMRATKQLSIKILENNTGVPRKILEHHRKYIIAAVEILSGEYPYLSEYLRPIREELNQ